MDRSELLVREYETITTQLVHWDTFCWHKSQFFLAVESILLAGVGQKLSEELTDGKPMHTRLFPMLVAIMLFNIFLCYVWFRTNRSNREYLKVRFERALQIEDDPDMSNVIQLYHLQQLILKDSRYAKHSSSWWETQLPSAFMIAWFAIVTAGAFDSDSFVFAIVAGLSIALVVGAIAWIERTGWPQAIRGTVKPSLESQPVAQGKMDKVH